MKIDVKEIIEQNNQRKICLSEASYFPAKRDNFRQFSLALIFGTFVSRQKYIIKVLKKPKAFASMTSGKAKVLDSIGVYLGV